MVRDLKRAFAGQTVRTGTLQGRFAESAALLDGTVLERTEAYGKHLFVRFSGRRELHVHLGLYGQFPLGARPEPAPKGALRLRLVGDGSYGDLRGPTACELLTPAEKVAILARLGPDPLRCDADRDRAYARLSRSRVSLAALLMDQAVLAGIGNVYRAEVLFRHRLDPYRPGKDLDPERFAAMWTDLTELMTAGVKSGRIVTTLAEDRDCPRGRPRLEDVHYVYRRTGRPCRVCGTPIRTAPVATRNLFWCPACQAE